ncbi:MAG: hypothetical protein EOP13_18405 [Pseudomonas sp.]|uniref:hypothetical protein n=1 Tax=Pseudomonas sp. TaxID=306 RepID=UPI00120B5AC7|nr:hypothetical protein [Pseudomonas sp.]RZI71319.1 MAG: hypothetical protein EOP13_18405 [Pseudomonas sp.]
MNVIDLHAFRVARAIKANSSREAGDSQSSPGGSFVVWLPAGTDLDDEEVRAAAVEAHRERTGWDRPCHDGAAEDDGGGVGAKYRQAELD